MEKLTVSVNLKVKSCMDLVESGLSHYKLKIAQQIQALLNAAVIFNFFFFFLNRVKLKLNTGNIILKIIFENISVAMHMLY